MRPLETNLGNLQEYFEDVQELVLVPRCDIDTPVWILALSDLSIAYKKLLVDRSHCLNIHTSLKTVSRNIAIVLLLSFSEVSLMVSSKSGLRRNSSRFLHLIKFLISSIFASLGTLRRISLKIFINLKTNTFYLKSSPVKFAWTME